MQTQRQQFIKSTRRKHSPKFKLQSGMLNQCQHKTHRPQNQQANQKQEEYCQNQVEQRKKKEPTYINLQQKNLSKNTNIVADLKYQLSFLKDQIAKISNQKPNKKQNQINESNRIGRYYFPSSNTPIQVQSKTKASIQNNSNSQQKVQALKFKKLKNLQKRIKSAKSTQKLIQKQKEINVSPVFTKENSINQYDNFADEFKKIKNAINNKYQNNFKQFTKQYTLNSEESKLPYDKDSQIKINQKITSKEQSVKEQERNRNEKEQQNSRNAKAAYELKSMKMKKTIKDNSIEIQNLRLKLQQQQKVHGQQKQNERQQFMLIEVLQKQLNLSKIKIITLQNVQKQLLSQLNQLTSHCKCKQLQKAVRQKEQQINSLQQKIQKKQSLLYNKQLQTLKLQRTIINLQKEKYNNFNTQRPKSKQKDQKSKSKQKDQKENQEKYRQEKQIKQKQNKQKQKQNKQKQNINLNGKNDRNNKSQKQMNLELRQIVKIQQKSLINLQSDLRYLQNQLNILTGIKQYSKRQTKLIEQLNQKICILESQKLNQKYRKY